MKRRADEKQRSISSFFKPTASKPASAKSELNQQKQDIQQAAAASEQRSKRQKPNHDKADVIEIDASDEDHGHAVEAEVLNPPAAAAAPPADAPRIPTTRNKARHTKAQAKLADTPEAVADAAGLAGYAPGADGASNRRQQQPKYTPLEQQVVALKAANPGVLLIVEVGYKMRFFGDDALTASRELGIYAYQDHNFMTASIPVQRLPIHVRRLVAAGHKVGIVRQVESAALKAASDNRSAPFTRSLTGLFTAATMDAAEKADKLGEASAMEASQELETLLGASSGSSSSSTANYLLVIAEQQLQQQLTTNEQQLQHQQEEASGSGLVGVLAVDVGSGDIAYGICSSSVSNSSSSSSSCSGSEAAAAASPLEAVLLSLSPADIVVMEPVSAATNRLLASYMAGSASRKCRLERQQQQQQQQRSGSGGAGSSAAGSSYLDASTLKQLMDFYGGSSDISSNGGSGSGDGQTAAAAAAVGSSSSEGNDDLRFILSLPQLVLQALAGAVTYLSAFGLTGVLRNTSGFRTLGLGQQMALDGNALRQLEVLVAGGDSGQQTRHGSLLHLLDRCCTGAGSRLLARWLAAPLADRVCIQERQDAVQALLTASGSSSSSSSGSSAQAPSASAVLCRLPAWLSGLRQDLERGLSRVAAGTAAPAEAVGLWQTLAQIPKALEVPLNPETRQLELAALSAALPSCLLVSLLAAAASPAAVAAAAQVLSWLDVGAAAKNDYLALFKSKEQFPGVFGCAAAVSAAEAQLQALLPRLAAAAGVASLSYVAIQNQGAWMVELPASRTNVPAGWVKVCATKKVCRYHTPEVKEGIAALARAQEQQAATASATWQQLLADFTAQHHAACREAVSAIAQLDALQSLAAVAASPGYCRPQFVDEVAPQKLSIVDGKHPMLDLALDGGAVGNSISLTWDGVRAAIVTGPNMGGKSVLIRQAAVTIIMAQLGSWVPASSCVLSVFDGVWTRMGARDCLLAGLSTFAEELGNASHILQHATNRSLVIMDELGRGTATHDGVAIATATLKHLVDVTKCLTLFVTHYPEVAALADSSSSSSGSINGDSSSSSSSSNGSGSCGHVATYHMSYVRHDPAAAAAALPVITFLYKLVPGAADASFGLNVAQMAGLPPSVVQRAAVIAAQLRSRVEPAAAAATAAAAGVQGAEQERKAFMDDEATAQRQLQTQQTQQGVAHSSSEEKMSDVMLRTCRTVVQQLQDAIVACPGRQSAAQQQQQQQQQRSPQDGAHDVLIAKLHSLRQAATNALAACHQVML